MNAIMEIANRIPAMSVQAVDKVRELSDRLRELPQVEIETQHTLHGGMYARTICIPAGVLLTGAFIRVPTLLVFQGDATVNTGEAEGIVLTGYHVLAASAHRRQAILAHADTYLTMAFATHATTVAEAEAEFTDDVHLLLSRVPGAVNHTTITGE